MNDTPLQLTVFRVGPLVCGIENRRIREIVGSRQITPVHGAPSFVRGVVNLRGQIMTVIDVGTKFDLAGVEKDRPDARQTRILVVQDGGEDVGLLVDAVDDVAEAPESELEAPPSNVSGVSGAYFRSIFKAQGELVCLLDLDRFFAA